MRFLLGDAPRPPARGLCPLATPGKGASLLLAGATLLIAACGSSSTPTATPTATFPLVSGSFGPGEPMPSRLTCDGEDSSPALSWSAAPGGTDTFALIVDDPDAPRGRFTHWVLFDLPASARELPAGVPTTEELESGPRQGRNDFGRAGYGGPCPPSGSPHRYVFTLYALDAPLNLEPGASKRQVVEGMEGHILGRARLVGTYER